MRGQKRLLKKAMGWSSCDKTTPMEMLDASVVTSKGFMKLGSASVMREDMAALSWWNEVVACAVHSNVVFLSKSVRPAAIVA